MNAEQANQKIEECKSYLALIEDDGDCPEVVEALHARIVKIKKDFAAQGVFFI